MPSSKVIIGFQPRMRSALSIENQLRVASCATVAGEASLSLPVRSAIFEAIVDMQWATGVETNIGPWQRLMKSVRSGVPYGVWLRRLNCGLPIH